MRLDEGPPSSAERVRGALLGTFVGDALGMPFEGAPPERVPERVEMLDARLGRGTYTDDTEMMIGLAEHLVEHEAVDPPALARRFLDGHDPRRGYGAGTLRLFERWLEGVPVETAAAEAFGGEGSLGNGAAMRISPIGVRFASDPARLCEEARRSAAITHAHPLGIDAAVAQAAAVGAAAGGRPIVAAARDAVATDDLDRRLAEAEALLARPRPPEPREAAAALGNTVAGPESVPLAIYAACTRSDFAGAVTLAVRCGGDTDTIAAMAGAIAGARDGAGAIPTEWLEALEDGPRGRSHVEALASEIGRLVV